MGSSASTPTSSPRTSPEMQTSITHHKVIPTNGNQPPQSVSAQKPLKGILKNKSVQKYEKPVKIVELYVQRGAEWKMTRVREDEIELRKKELKSDKSVKRVYTKPGWFSDHQQSISSLRISLSLQHMTRLFCIFNPFDKHLRNCYGTRMISPNKPFNIFLFTVRKSFNNKFRLNKT